MYPSCTLVRADTSFGVISLGQSSRAAPGAPTVDSVHAVTAADMQAFVTGFAYEYRAIEGRRRPQFSRYRACNYRDVDEIERDRATNLSSLDRR
jgi:hypothetical protein